MARREGRLAVARRALDAVTYYTGRAHLKHRIAFVHVPKCGGTSLVRAVRRHYPPVRLGPGDPAPYIVVEASTAAAQFVDPEARPDHATQDYEILQFRQQLAAYHLSQKVVHMVAGHFPFDPRLQDVAGPSFRWMTILRDPVDRWLSHYYYNRYKGDDHARIQQELATHAATPYAASQGYEFVKFLGGPRADGAYASRAAIDAAKANLERFDLVGVLEHMDAFMASFRDRFGVRPRLRRLNVNPATGSSRPPLDPDSARSIERLCAPDLEVYARALELAGLPERR